MGECCSTHLTQEEKKKLEQGKPIQIKKGVSIQYNRETGEFEGVPKGWASNPNIPLKANLNTVIKTDKFPEPIRANYDLPDAITDLINSRP